MRGKQSVVGGSTAILLAGMCLVLLAACGQKGPLTLPAAAKTPSAAASAASAPR
ncbi:MAG: lipoprotein [Chitinophagaceae bacterium]|nr:lipoprotein [Rubrivivax sp.]